MDPLIEGAAGAQCSRTRTIGVVVPTFSVTGARLRIMQLLMTAEPKGMVVGEIQSELEIPGSTLSHHLDKLSNEDLVTVRREGTFLWYRANTDALKDLLGFLYAECCTRNRVIAPKDIVAISK
jgi:ArsR family transcriptional regulator